MQRIMIIGCSGTGKSTLARRLGDRLGLPVVHLDALFWEPGWKQARTEVFQARVAEAIRGERWVTDGLYNSKTFPLRLPRADTIIWLHQPRWLRLRRVIGRTLSGYGREREDLGPECPERFDRESIEFYRYIWDFDRVTGPKIGASLAALGRLQEVIHLRGDREIEAFLARLPEAA